MDELLLRKIIKNKGMKYQFIADKLGISRETLHNKITGKSEFTVTEMRGLTDILKLEFEEIQSVFFS